MQTESPRPQAPQVPVEEAAPAGAVRRGADRARAHARAHARSRAPTGGRRRRQAGASVGAAGDPARARLPAGGVASVGPPDAHADRAPARPAGLASRASRRPTLRAPRGRERGRPRGPRNPRRPPSAGGSVAHDDPRVGPLTTTTTGDEPVNRAVLAATANDLQRLATRLQGEVVALQTDPNRLRVEMARRGVGGRPRCGGPRGGLPTAPSISPCLPMLRAIAPARNLLFFKRGCRESFAVAHRLKPLSRSGSSATCTHPCTRPPESRPAAAPPRAADRPPAGPR